MPTFDNLPMGDSHLIVDICRQHFVGIPGRPRFGVEVGCYRGETSAKLLAAFPHLQLVMVDQWKGDLPDDDPYRLTGDGVSKLTQAEQDANKAAATAAVSSFVNRRTILNLASKKASQRVSGRTFDFVFIDGNHSYESVAEDIAAWWPLVKGGGLLAGHDYNHPANQRGNFGVKRAVDEFAATEGVEVKLMGSCWWMAKP